MTTADDLLRRALESLNDREAQLKELGCGCLAARALEEDIRAYLDAPEMKDEPKPVLYIKDKELMYIQVLKQEGIAQEWRSNLGFVKEDGDVGLYTHPQTKTAPMKPMTDAERDKGYVNSGFPPDLRAAFHQGIRFAENFHGIGDGDNEL